MSDAPLPLREAVRELRKEGVIITLSTPPEKKADYLEAATMRAFKIGQDVIKYGWGLEKREGEDLTFKQPTMGPFRGLGRDKEGGQPKRRWTRERERGRRPAKEATSPPDTGLSI